MATPAEIAAKHDEFSAAILALSVADVEWQATRAPYFEKRLVLTEAIKLVGRIDDELEALIGDYEPPEPPGAE